MDVMTMIALCLPTHRTNHQLRSVNLHTPGDLHYISERSILILEIINSIVWETEQVLTTNFAFNFIFLEQQQSGGGFKHSTTAG